MDTLKKKKQDIANKMSNAGQKVMSTVKKVGKKGVDFVFDAMEKERKFNNSPGKEMQENYPNGY